MVRGCGFETAAMPDSLDSLFRHFIDAHPSVHANGDWPNLVDLVVRGLHVKPNTQYWPLTAPLGDLQCPVAVAKPSPAQLLSSIVAARWAACENFHCIVVSRHRSYRKAQRREGKSGEHRSSASKGGHKAPLEPVNQTPSESTDERKQFRHSMDEAATASRKAKTPSKKGGGSSAGQGGPKESKSSASSVTKPGSGKASKRMRKEAGLTEKPRSIPTKFPNCQRQTLLSVLRHKPLANVTSTSNRKRRPLRRVRLLSLRKGQTLRPRLGEGLLLSSPCLSLTCHSTIGLTIAQGTILFPLTLSAWSGREAWCSFEAPDTTH